MAAAVDETRLTRRQPPAGVEFSSSVPDFFAHPATPRFLL
jgi:hypothetical protein